MTRGSNDLLNECYRRMARADRHRDWLVTIACIVLTVLIGVYA